PQKMMLPRSTVLQLGNAAVPPGQGAQPGAGASPKLGGPHVLTPEQEAISKSYGEQAGEIMKAAKEAPKAEDKLLVMGNARQYFTPGATGEQRLVGARYWADIAPKLGLT